MDNKIERIELRLPLSLVKDIDQLNTEKDRSRSDFLRELINSGLNEKNGNNYSKLLFFIKTSSDDKKNELIKLISYDIGTYSWFYSLNNNSLIEVFSIEPNSEVKILMNIERNDTISRSVKIIHDIYKMYQTIYSILNPNNTFRISDNSQSIIKTINDIARSKDINLELAGFHEPLYNAMYTLIIENERIRGNVLPFMYASNCQKININEILPIYEKYLDYKEKLNDRNIFSLPYYDPNDHDEKINLIYNMFLTI